MDRIRSAETLPDYKIRVTFDDGVEIVYDMNYGIDNWPGYDDLKVIDGLFEQMQLDTSRTYLYWNDYIDIPADVIRPEI